MPIRYVVIDTETTGFAHRRQDRLIEVGAVEIINARATDKTLHQRLNPNRPIPSAATAVHGIRDEDVSTCPSFETFAPTLLSFVADSTLVFHNKAFDLSFINTALERSSQPTFPSERSICTMLMGRRHFGVGKLDSLCDELGIDRSTRQIHGALIDAELTAQCFLKMLEMGISARTATATSQLANSKLPAKSVSQIASYDYWEPSSKAKTTNELGRKIITEAHMAGCLKDFIERLLVLEVETVIAWKDDGKEVKAFHFFGDGEYLKGGYIDIARSKMIGTRLEYVPELMDEYLLTMPKVGEHFSNNGDDLRYGR